MSSNPLLIALPRFDYMSQKNTYSGSQGRFRYKVFPDPDRDGGPVFAAAVYSDNCYEVELEADRVTRKDFEYSEAGIDAAEAWIREQYAAFDA